jgi:hypothetical protein
MSVQDMLLRLPFLTPEAKFAEQKRIPSCTPFAPREKAATTPLASAMPPAAITGMEISSNTCGINANSGNSSDPLMLPVFWNKGTWNLITPQTAQYFHKA